MSTEQAPRGLVSTDARAEVAVHVAAARVAGTWTGSSISAGDVLRLAPRDLHRKAHGCCEEDSIDWARECAATPHALSTDIQHSRDGTADAAECKADTAECATDTA